MGELGISEFTFAYAFLYEQTQKNWKDLKAVPILPNLRQEKDAAWDVHFPLKGADYYYQFKLSDYLKRRNAKFFKPPNNYYSDPYFKIKLYRDKTGKYHQHRALKQFAQTHPHTYYVAPEFTTNDNFSDIFLSKDVSNYSRLIPLRNCKNIDELDTKSHCITFQRGQKKWRFHSESEECDESYFGKDLHEFYLKQGQSDKWQDINEKYILNLYEKILGSIKEILTEDKTIESYIHKKYIIYDHQDLNSRLLLDRISDLLGAYFGLTLVLVGEPRKLTRYNQQ